MRVDTAKWALCLWSLLLCSFKCKAGASANIWWKSLGSDPALASATRLRVEDANEISVPGGKTWYRVKFPYIAEGGNQHAGQQPSAFK